MRIIFQLKRVPLPLILIFTFVLAACGPKFPPSGQLEKTVNGHTLVMEWETGEGDLGACRILMYEKRPAAGEITILFEPCTAKLLIDHLQEIKNNAPSSMPDWAFELWDQFIAELRQLE